MTKDLNKVMIIGRVGTDPEMRYTANDNPVTTFRVAVSRQWKGSTGEMREETEWFSIVTWNKLAEICYQHLARNIRVYIEGRLQTRAWEDAQTGQVRYKTEIVASDMILLDGRPGRDQAPAAPDDAPPASPAATQDDDLTPPLEFNDDDIPL